MCLIAFAWRPGHAVPLVLAANRDEFYARPALPLAAWEESPSLYAGRDLEAGGTWLGIAPGGRFAALTNIRDPRQPPRGRSRGELPVQYLRGDLSPEAFVADVAERANDYSVFNLILGDDRELWHFNSRTGSARCLPAGLYGLSNADLDTPWPKVQQAKAVLHHCLGEPRPEALLNLLHDAEQADDAILPDTGIGLNTERLLSSIFIATANYGTRASTALIMQADGVRHIVERSYGPHGGHLGEVSLRVDAQGRTLV